MGRKRVLRTFSQTAQLLGVGTNAVRARVRKLTIQPAGYGADQGKGPAPLLSWADVVRLRSSFKRRPMVLPPRLG